MADQVLPHHLQQPLCTNRPPYRQGRELKAVKSYTVNNESTYLIISKVPDLDIHKELKRLCNKFGPTKEVTKLDDYPHDKFETTYKVNFQMNHHARKAKKNLDGRSFFGGIMHVFYEPEFESVDETRKKLDERRKTVEYLLQKNEPVLPGSCLTDTKSKHFNAEHTLPLSSPNPIKFSTDTRANFQNSFQKQIQQSQKSKIPSQVESEDPVNRNANIYKDWKKQTISKNLLVSNTVLAGSSSHENFKKSTVQPSIHGLAKPVKIVVENYQPPSKRPRC